MLKRRSAVRLLTVFCVALGACSWHAQPLSQLSTLAVSVADLELHLRDDSYRSFAYLTPEGRNLFELTRWKLERAQRQRPSDPEQWIADDEVLEFARARTLERLHLYREAADAYQRVALKPSRLAEPAQRAADVMERFAAKARPLQASAGDEQLAEIDARIADWNDAALHQGDDAYASLAREEAESWEVLRVEFFARERSQDEAIAACEELIQHHRTSKLYSQHLLRLGDLHAEFARQAVIHARAERTVLAEAGYEQHIEAAFSAYELAREGRNPVLRQQAQSRLQSLLTYHDGVRSGVH